MKTSQQAQLIHADLSAVVARLKQQRSEELAAVERRRTESVRALQDQLDEMSKTLEEIRT